MRRLRFWENRRALYKLVVEDEERVGELAIDESMVELDAVFTFEVVVATVMADVLVANVDNAVAVVPASGVELVEETM